MMFPKRPNRNFYHQTNQRNNHPFNPYKSLNRREPGNNMQQLMQQFSDPNSQVNSIATKGADGISKTLNNVQQVLKVVQTTTPIVQQYGPMVKNLPMMYKMMKALKEVEGEEGQQIDNESSETSTKSYTSTQSKKQTFNGQSTPKLYI